MSVRCESKCREGSGSVYVDVRGYRYKYVCGKVSVRRNVYLVDWVLDLREVVEGSDIAQLLQPDVGLQPIAAENANSTSC